MRLVLPSGTPAELARPSGPATRGVALAPDIMGLRPLFDELCSRLADEHGWAVCAPEPFPGREHLGQPDREIGSNDDERALGDLVAAAEVLGTDRVAVLGFCQGGMWALKAAGTGRFDRAVSFYGFVRVDWARPGHAQPLDWLARPEACPTLAFMGGRDSLVPVGDAELLSALPHVEVVVYPEGQHGFAHDATRATHRPIDAADAFARTAVFLA
ncbi:MAG: dienelactone hydrolase family protein [Acidimicrobiales bacterium]